MKKIERYELCPTDGRSPEEILVEERVANKLDELVEALNQSQKQPEEKKDSEVLREILGEDKREKEDREIDERLAEEFLEPEKQEGWLEDMRKGDMANLDKLSIKKKK